MQASSSAAPAPPAPVGQRSQIGATSTRPTSTNADSQKLLLEQRRGRTHFILDFWLESSEVLLVDNTLRSNTVCTVFTVLVFEPRHFFRNWRFLSSAQFLKFRGCHSKIMNKVLLKAEIPTDIRLLVRNLFDSFLLTVSYSRGIR